MQEKSPIVSADCALRGLFCWPHVRLAARARHPALLRLLGRPLRRGLFPARGRFYLGGFRAMGGAAVPIVRPRGWRRAPWRLLRVRSACPSRPRAMIHQRRDALSAPVSTCGRRLPCACLRALALRTRWAAVISASPAALQVHSTSRHHPRGAANAPEASRRRLLRFRHRAGPGVLPCARGHDRATRHERCALRPAQTRVSQPLHATCPRSRCCSAPLGRRRSATSRPGTTRRSAAPRGRFEAGGQVALQRLLYSRVYD